MPQSLKKKSTSRSRAPTPVPLRYVLFKEDSNTHEEVYLTRVQSRAHGVGYGFTSVKDPDDANVKFDNAKEGYEFCKEFKQLQYWRVGRR